MSRQFFIQFKRHLILYHSSVHQLDSIYSGSGSQALRMGTPKTARRKGLASTGAGFRKIVLFIPPTLIDFTIIYFGWRLPVKTLMRSDGFWFKVPPWKIQSPGETIFKNLLRMKPVPLWSEPGTRKV